MDYTERMGTILDAADLIKSYGGPFEFRLNRKQPKGTIIKMTRTNRDPNYELEDEYNTVVKYFFKPTDVFSFLHRKNDNNNDKLEIALRTIPSSYNVKNFHYDFEYVEANNVNKIYRLDLTEININSNDSITYWMDESKTTVYKYLSAQDRYSARAWKTQKSGKQTLLIKEITFDKDYLASKMTDEEAILWR